MNKMKGKSVKDSKPSSRQWTTLDDNPDVVRINPTFNPEDQEQEGGENRLNWVTSVPKHQKWVKIKRVDNGFIVEISPTSVNPYQAVLSPEENTIFIYKTLDEVLEKLKEFFV